MKVNGARSKSKKGDQLVAAGALHVWSNITYEAIKKFKMAKTICGTEDLIYALPEICALKNVGDL